MKPFRPRARAILIAAGCLFVILFVLHHRARNPGEIQQPLPVMAPAPRKPVTDTLPDAQQDPQQRFLQLIPSPPATGTPTFTTHLTTLYHLLTLPRPRARLISIDIQAAPGSKPTTRLQVETGGRGAVIDADILLRELADEHTQKHPPRAELVNRLRLPPAGESAHVRLPLDYQLEGWLYPQTGPRTFIPPTPIDVRTDRTGIDAVEHVLIPLANALNIGLHVLQEQPDPPRAPTKKSTGISVSTDRFSSLIRLVYLLEYHLGVTVHRLTGQANQDPETPGMDVRLHTQWQWQTTHTTNAPGITKTLSDSLWNAAQAILEEPLWDPLMPLDGPQARAAAAQGGADPGVPNWEQAAEHVQIRTVTRDGQGRPMLITTAGKVREGEQIRVVAGYWEYIWRAHSFSRTSGQLDPVDARPLTPPGLLNENDTETQSTDTPNR